jgi:hypothetical protein
MRLPKVDDRGLLIAGIEERWDRRQLRASCQALWCRPIDTREPMKTGRIDSWEETDQLAASRRRGAWWPPAATRLARNEGR